MGGALRRALVDFYYHSVRLVVANVAWGLGLIVVLALATSLRFGEAIVAVALLGVLWAGIVRLATLIVRGEDVVLTDAVVAWRRWLVPAAVTGLLTGIGGGLLWFNVLIGLSSGGLLGWTLMTLAAWGILLLWLFELAFWPLLVDPARDGIRSRDAARLAALVVLARPLRLGGLGLILAVIAVLSTLAIAAVLSVSAAYVALAAGHLVLPIADRLEGRSGG